MITTRKFHCKLALGAAAALFACTTFAADPGAQARYRKDMAVCNSGQSNQEVGTCRIEAQRALAAARDGSLNDAPGQYQSNAVQRCGVLKGDGRIDCDSRMRGSWQGRWRGHHPRNRYHLPSQAGFNGIKPGQAGSTSPWSAGRSSASAAGGPQLPAG